MTASPLGDAFAHHAWATDRLIDACTALTPEQLEFSVPGTYGSIVGTLRHLVSSDRWYLSFFPSGAGLVEVDEEADLSLATLRAEMATNATAWTELLTGDVDPDQDIVEIGDRWEEHSPVGVRLAQVVHHGTDHRSQVCTTLTVLGLTPPDIDVWAYARESGRERLVASPKP
jgi:uncharacterized damage-inducible protein DinB